MWGKRPMPLPLLVVCSFSSGETGILSTKRTWTTCYETGAVSALRTLCRALNPWKTGDASCGQETLLGRVVDEIRQGEPGQSQENATGAENCTCHCAPAPGGTLTGRGPRAVG